MKDEIQVGDRKFVPFLTAAELQARVQEMGEAISRDYAGKQPYFLVMLKGAFVFAADLVRHIQLPIEIGFTRVSSYIGTASSQQVRIIAPPDPDEIAGKDVIVVEDIVDSGLTLHTFLPLLQEMGPKSLAIATLLYNPEMMEKDLSIDYQGFSIPPKFVVGYGLDYNGLGRNLPDIHELKD